MSTSTSVSPPAVAQPDTLLLASSKVEPQATLPVADTPEMLTNTWSTTPGFILSEHMLYFYLVGFSVWVIREPVSPLICAFVGCVSCWHWNIVVFRAFCNLGEWRPVYYWINVVSDIAMVTFAAAYLALAFVVGDNDSDVASVVFRLIGAVFVVGCVALNVFIAPPRVRIAKWIKERRRERERMQNAGL